MIRTNNVETTVTVRRPARLSCTISKWFYAHFLCTKIRTRSCEITGNLQHHRLVGEEQGPAERHRRRPVQKGIEQTVGGDLRRPSGSVRWRSRRRRQR